MRSYTTTLLLLFALAAGTSPLAYGQAPLPGDCQPGRAEKDLDVNNVLARMFNTGSLFFGNTTVAGDGYLVPQSSGRSPVFATGIWIGGQVDGEIRVAGATYADFEFWPGPLNDDGTLPNPSDCGEFDRIYKVSRADILAFEGGQPAAADLAAWPAELGAPVIAAPGNNFDDDGDGLVDEGTDGVDNDGDGFADERDEQERVVASIRQGAGLPIYNLAGGDRPEIVGDQGLWWIMNDLGNTHTNTLTPPIGVEVQVLAFSFARADALNDVTFYRYTVIKKSPGTLSETYFSIFSDPDLGDPADDYVGADTTLSLGFVYNADNADDGGLNGGYGATPPALGYDFFQGPIVDADGDGEVDDTLGVTRFSYFSNVGGTPTSDPNNGEEIYNYMQAQWRDGVPMTEGGDGYQTTGPLTNFAFPGDPVTEQFWSEVNIDGTGADTAPGDRRFLVTTGPFELEQGDTQTIVFGMVFAQGSNNLDSITQLRLADDIAQTAYDIDFELAAAPPPPPRCNPRSTNAQLLPGSGNCLEAIETDGRAALVWGYPTNSPNYLGRYETFDRLLSGIGASDSTYNFEAFKIYRYPTSSFATDQRELLATYDVINDVTTVIDTAFSAEIGQFVAFLALDADNTGIEYSFDLTPLGLTNYTDYYFGITALAYSELSIPKVIESAATTITVRPSNLIAGNGGSVAPSNIGQILDGVRSGGVGAGTLQARVVDPTQITGATYSVEVVEFDTGRGGADSLATTFRILRDGEPVFSGVDVFDMVRTSVDSTGVLIMPGDQRIVIDGLEFFQVEPLAIPAAFAATDDDEIANFAGNNAGIIEVANPSGEVCPQGALDTGCQFPSYLGGNTVWRSPNSTNSYVLTNPSNTIGDLERDLGSAAPEDYEIRFTEACATPNTCFAVYATPPIAPPGGDNVIASVPFELWNVGNARAGFAEDDVRMIPILRVLDDTEPVANWADSYPGTQDVIVTTRREVNNTTVTRTDTLDLPVTSRVIGVMPDRLPVVVDGDTLALGGYDLFAQAARDFGGAGATYDPDNDGDEQVDPNPASGNDCRSQNYYADFCFRASSTAARIVAPIGGLEGLVFADLDTDGATPPAGTTVRFLTSPKTDLLIGDRADFDTSTLQFQTQQAAVAEEALDLIGIVPNPYMGVSAYETNNLDRVVRFINLPDQATISIYTVAGTLIRTIQKDGPSRSLDWDLNTHNQLPVASGMYLIHVDVPGVGEKVLKFGVVNRRNRITIF
ncbi:MAG: T9SS type A sorting domain-containing protein [Rhodothermales bacterium]